MATVVTNIELYEELKKSLTERGARMLAEVVPASAQLATRDDIRRLEAKVDQVDRKLEQKIDRLESRMFRFALVLFLPMWVGVFGALVAIAWRI